MESKGKKALRRKSKIDKSDQPIEDAEQERNPIYEEPSMKTVELKKTQAQKLKEIEAFNISARHKTEIRRKWNGLCAEFSENMKKQREELWWQRYLACDGKPDPLIPSEVNTFLAVMDTGMAELDVVLERNQLLQELLDDIDLAEHWYPDISLNITQEWFEQKNTIHKMMYDNIMQAILKIMLETNLLVDLLSGNLQYFQQIPPVTVCLWANFTKNPKNRGYDFAPIHFHFALPRSVVVMDCALKVVHTEYDHFSWQCWSYVCHKKPLSYSKSSEQISSVPLVPGIEKVEDEEETAITTEEEEESTIIDEQTNTSDKKEYESSSKDLSPSASKEGLSEGMLTSSVSKENQGLDISSSQISETVIGQVEDTEESFEPRELELGEINLRELIVLGGVWYIDLLRIPPQPKRIETWIITQIEQPRVLKKLEYEFSDFIVPLEKRNITPVKKMDEVESDVMQKTSEFQKLLHISFKLSSNILWLDAQHVPLVARWDFTKQCWTTNDFYEMKYDEENGLYSFRVAAFGPVAVLQNKYTALPYQSWSIIPDSVDMVTVNLQSAAVQATFHILGNQCCLTQLQSNEQNYFQDLYMDYMHPKVLLKKLQRLGVNFYPDFDSHQYVKGEMIEKNWHLENNVYMTYAMVCNAFSMASSRWNSSQPEDKIIIRFQEYLSEEIKGSQYLVKVTHKDCVVLNINDTSQEYSDEAVSNLEEICGTLYHLVQEAGTDKAKDIVAQNSHELIEGTYQMLSCMRLLSYTQ